MVGRYLLLPFYFLGLGITALPTIVVLTLVRFSRFHVLFLSLILLVLVILSFVFQSTSPLPSAIRRQQLEMRITFFESLREQQPLHRDVLLNLANLHQALGNSEQAQKYLEQAKQLDPNNPIFQEKSLGG